MSAESLDQKVSKAEFKKLLKENLKVNATVFLNIAKKLENHPEDFHKYKHTLNLILPLLDVNSDLYNELSVSDADHLEFYKIQGKYPFAKSKINKKPENKPIDQKSYHG